MCLSRKCSPNKLPPQSRRILLLSCAGCLYSLSHRQFFSHRKYSVCCECEPLTYGFSMCLLNVLFMKTLLNGQLLRISEMTKWISWHKWKACILPLFKVLKALKSREYFQWKMLTLFSRVGSFSTENLKTQFSPGSHEFYYNSYE